MIYGIALTITCIALIGFEYLSFLGLTYYVEGYGIMLPIPNYLFSGLTVLACTILTFFLIMTLCKSKSSRNRRQGLPREIAAGVITLMILSAQSMMFMKFLAIYDNKENLEKDVYKMRDECKNINEAYKIYANQRILDFQSRKKYYGEYQNSTSKSLKRRILPDGLDSLTTARNQWLGTLMDVSVWNILTANNVRMVMDASERWVKEYQNISMIIYKNEVDKDGNLYSHFEHPASTQMRVTWIKHFKNIDVIDFRTLSTLIFILLSILMSYLSVKRPKNIVQGTHNRH